MSAIDDLLSSIYDTGGAAYSQGAQAGANLSNQQANQMFTTTGQAVGMADPFASQRPQYQNMLSQLLTSPTSSSAYNALNTSGMNLGLSAVNRGAATSGMLNAGNRLTSLMNYGSNLGAGNYFNLANLLSNLAMSGSSPGAAAQALMSGIGATQNLQGQATKQQVQANQPRPGTVGNTGLTQAQLASLSGPSIPGAVASYNEPGSYGATGLSLNSGMPSYGGGWGTNVIPQESGGYMTSDTGGMYNFGGYNPTDTSGGYVTSDSGTSYFGSSPTSLMDYGTPGIGSYGYDPFAGYTNLMSQDYSNWGSGTDLSSYGY